MEKVIVTRHPALVELLIERQLVEAGTPVIEHATPEQVAGKDVIGVLPLSLAALANTITEIPLRLTADMRGKELDLNTLRSIAGEAATYKVAKV